jgi:hypothetical protein
VDLIAQAFAGATAVAPHLPALEGVELVAAIGRESISSRPSCATCGGRAC